MDKVFAFDCDGVVFKFTDDYGRLFKEKFGIDFPQESSSWPVEWNWELQKATKDQVKLVWKHIDGIGSYNFWRFLPAYPDAKAFLSKAQNAGDLVFITARSGKNAQRATEDALSFLGVKDPKVLISHYKVPDLIKIGATDFVDDRDKNFEDIVFHNHNVHTAEQGEFVRANLWIVDRPWNRHFNRSDVKRISSPLEVF